MTSGIKRALQLRGLSPTFTAVNVGRHTLYKNTSIVIVIVIVALIVYIHG